MATRFEEEYKKLNKAQKEAVDTIEGPVMVVAGPGTGKTQVLALRIGNILKKTDTAPESILCLTFTNSGVRAMQERLQGYIGPEGSKVSVSTFHSFALKHLIEKHYQLLGFTIEPKILSDEEAVFLVDEILHEHDWQHIRPRAKPEMYFSELKQLISVLKRERISSEEFLRSLEEEIIYIQNDPDSISSRGESKGKLKKEVEKKLESLERTKEVVEFFRLYEEKKISLSLLDYDDILENAVRLVEEFEDVRADVYENYQYVLVDEHQDSSGVQNSFLKAVWKEVEKPNIFVVGDDRQLIYGFSGASLSYFEEFSRIFQGTKLITLTESYRSTAPILSLAEDLLQSSMSDGKLLSNIKGKGEIHLSEYAYPRDEIIGAGMYFKKKIEEGAKPEECALLVPRNRHVRSAIGILEGMGLKTSSGKDVSLFDIPEAKSFLRILGIVADPVNSVLLAESLLDKTSGIDPLSAHKFLKGTNPKYLSIEEIKSFGSRESLFGGGSIAKWGESLEKIVKDFSNESVERTVSMVGREFLIDKAENHEELVRNSEVVRTFIHLAELFRQRKKDARLSDFLAYLARLDSYGSHISLATFNGEAGIQVMTLHRSKGLEYKAVWVAHMNEEILMSEKRTSFSMPEKIKEHIKERDVLAAKRELYVAITRAKEFCGISYVREDYQGRELSLAKIISELPENHFVKKSAEETGKELLSFGPEVYVPTEGVPAGGSTIVELQEFVRKNYSDTKVSVTLLNNFFECPWKWYFRNFLKLPEMKSKSLALGSAVHEAIEFVLNSKSIDEKSIEKKIEECLIREDASASPAERKKMIKDGAKAVANFINGFYKTISKEYLSERPLSFRDSRFPNLLMYGKIDLSEKLEDGGVAVTDFKTGSVKTKGMIEKYDDEGRLSVYMRQLAMYSYLVAGAEKGKEVSLSRLLYLEAPAGDRNGVYSTKVSMENIDLLLRDITEYDKLLSSGEWVNRPCHFNSFGKNEECEHCKMAKIYR
ncbi:MAG TPA: ATP-dependent DNA helicase [Candidatus Paceibacterota bacterium]|nr:ATP-dependent DNA helicase [Candidatus Paceibacterota bacterium]